MVKTDQVPVWPKRCPLYENETDIEPVRFAWLMPNDGWPHKSEEFYEIEFISNN